MKNLKTDLVENTNTKFINYSNFKGIHKRDDRHRPLSVMQVQEREEQKEEQILAVQEANNKFKERVNNIIKISDFSDFAKETGFEKDIAIFTDEQLEDEEWRVGAIELAKIGFNVWSLVHQTTPISTVKDVEWRKNVCKLSKLVEISEIELVTCLEIEDIKNEEWINDTIELIKTGFNLREILILNLKLRGDKQWLLGAIELKKSGFELAKIKDLNLELVRNKDRVSSIIKLKENGFDSSNNT